MNYGSLGCIHGNELFLPSNVLRPLCTGARGRLTAMLYPPPVFDPEYSKSYESSRGDPSAAANEDLLISPIPSSFWSCSMRLVIYLSQNAQSMAPLTHTMSELGLSILTTECGRSGHRYATWIFTAFSEFHANSSKPLTFDEAQGANLEIIAKCREVEQVLMEKYKDTSLFCDPLNGSLRSVNCAPLRSLAYFDHYLGRLREQHEIEDIYHLRPISVGYDGCRISEEGAWLDILRFLEKEKGVSLPTFVVADLDAHQMTVRVALLPKARRHCFFEATLSYHRFTGSKTTRGLLATLLDRLPEQYNMWKLAAHTEQHTVAGEKGTLYWLIEDQTAGESDPEALLKGARNTFEELCAVDFAGADLGSVSVQPVSEDSVRESIVREELGSRYAADVLICHTLDSRDVAERIEQVLIAQSLIVSLSEASVHSRPGAGLPSRLPLQQHRELCLILSRSCVNGDWVKFLVGAAWALGMHIEVFLHGVQESDLPADLRGLRQTNGFYLDQYVEEVQRRRGEAERSRRFER